MALKDDDTRLYSPAISRGGQKIRVAFVLPTLMAGGAERVLITLMNGLSRELFDLHFIVINEQGTLRPWISGDIPYYSLGQGKISRGLPKLLDTLNGIEPDVIVSTMAAMNFGVLLIRPFLKKPARIIVREAVIPSSIIEKQKWPWIVKLAYKTLYPTADMVISPAGCIIDEFRDYLGMDISRHHILHNPVDIKKIRAGASEEIPCDAERGRTVHFICAGRLHAQKGFDRLITALKDLRMPYEWRLDILGAGPEENNLRDLIAASGLEKRVFLQGLVEKPWPAIAAADALLLPSRWEGLPNVVLESLAVGTRVIAMREAGGIEEIADKTEPDFVRIADTIADFIQMMSRVEPVPASSYRGSLLAPYFHLQSVMERFSRLLADCVIQAK